MSAEPFSEAELQAYVDGRLPEARAAALETWLAAHPEEAHRLADYRRLSEALRAAFDPLLDEAVPPRLSRAPGRRALWRRSAMAAMWLLVGVAIGVIATARLATSPTPASGADLGETIARRAAIAHATYSPEVRHPVEVGAEQEDHLVAWLSKRLGTPLRAPKLEDVGYSLVGGRLLPGDSGPVAQFMYQCNAGTRVTLYVRSGARNNAETAFRYAKEGNVRVFYWVDQQMGYALSSADISKADLYKVANRVYRDLNP